MIIFVIMRNFIRIIILSFILPVIMSSCESGEPANPADTTPSTPGASSVRRTVLVYMVANNSLGASRYDELDLDEMYEARTRLGDARWLVYRAPRDGAPQLLELTDDDWLSHKTYDNDIFSVSSERMSEVIDDVKRIAPAESYGLVLWSHAHGWLQNGLEEPVVQAKSFGDDRGHTMNITTLAEVLDGRGFDYIYMDCCYMASVEVAYQLRGVTDHIIASACELPANGMPYDQNVPLLADGSTESLVRAATNTFDNYDALTGTARTCTMSVIDTSALDRLAAAVRAVYVTSDGVEDGYVPQRFMTVRTGYYYDLADYLDAHTDVSEDIRAEYRAALNEAVIYAAATPYIWNSVPINTHCGLTTYILDSKESAQTKNYYQLEWWDNIASAKFNR